ncbi:hypothetical protein L6452_18015 [Arctium lappa]|uniref:Uncharacterized protein n=1 Tax=Arctium lappa TaxID=4217 RepID=A0ACB9C4Z6_ARCLA|nr:hypothetical protein L6452_18015 [Arctium lappa]
MEIEFFTVAGTGGRCCLTLALGDITILVMVTVLVMVTTGPFNFTTTSSYTIAASPGDVKLVSYDEDHGSSSTTGPTTSDKHL